MSAVAKTRLLPDTSLNIVNRTASASTITKNRIVGVGTPVGSELAVESLDVAGASAAFAVIQEDIESGKGGTGYGHAVTMARARALAHQDAARRGGHLLRHRQERDPGHGRRDRGRAGPHPARRAAQDHRRLIGAEETP